MKFETDRLVCEIRNDLAHVRFKGPEVAEYTQACQLGPELRRIVSGYEFKVMVVDCEALNFLTSTVLEAFVGVYLRCRRLGRELRVVADNPLMREVLRTTHLDKIIPIFERLDEALPSGT